MTAFSQAVARLLFLPILVVSLAFLAKGYSSTGDGFSAGVIAGTGVILQYIVFGRKRFASLLLVRFAPAGVLAGLLIALLVAFMPTLVGFSILRHIPPPGSPVVQLGTVELHTAFLFDIGVFLIVSGFVVAIIDRIGKEAEKGDL